MAFGTYGNTKKLNIEKWCASNRLHDDPLAEAVEKYKSHPAITKI